MDKIVGQTVVRTRAMTTEEMEAEGWCHGTVVIVLSNGVLLYPSSDSEGNDCGVIFGKDGDNSFMLDG